MSWDDLRFFLAIARHGTLSDAARNLHVSHTTVARRLEQLQQSSGVELLTKTPNGFVLTDHGQALLRIAERVESEAHAAERVLVGASSLEGRLTVTTIDVIVELYWKALESFMAAHSEVELVVRLDNRPFDLARRQADVAIRYSNAPPPGLVGRKLGRHALAPFAARSLAARIGRTAGYAAYPWIMWTEDQHARLTEAWYRQHVGRPPAARVNHAMALGQMARAGAGAVIVTEAVGRLWELEAIGPRIPGFDIDLWLLTHPDLKHAGRVRAFIDTFVEQAVD